MYTGLFSNVYIDEYIDYVLFIENPLMVYVMHNIYSSLLNV